MQGCHDRLMPKLHIPQILFSALHLLVLSRLVVVFLKNIVRHIDSIRRNLLRLSGVQRPSDVAAPERVRAYRGQAFAGSIVRGRFALVNVAVHRTLSGVVAGASHRVDVPLDSRRLTLFPVRGHEQRRASVIVFLAGRVEPEVVTDNVGDLAADTNVALAFRLFLSGVSVSGR